MASLYYVVTVDKRCAIDIEFFPTEEEANRAYSSKKDFVEVASGEVGLLTETGPIYLKKMLHRVVQDNNQLKKAFYTELLELKD